MTVHVLHVVRAFSAQPTLGASLSEILPGGVLVQEAPFPEALVTHHEPDVVWISSADPICVDALRERFPAAALLATLPAHASPTQVVEVLGSGADLTLRDGGVVLAAAAIAALVRRRRHTLTPA